LRRFRTIGPPFLGWRQHDSHQLCSAARGEELDDEVLDPGVERGAAELQSAVQTVFDADVNLPFDALLWLLPFA
jgi:hypothetical protein